MQDSKEGVFHPAEGEKGNGSHDPNINPDIPA
jgi:hypothetical protein